MDSEERQVRKSTILGILSLSQALKGKDLTARLSNYPILEKLNAEVLIG
jgi:hypothetical protein